VVKLCADGGEYCHVVRYQLNTTDLVSDHKVRNKVIRYPPFKLYDAADQFVWDEQDRIKNFSSENFLKIAELFRKFMTQH